MSRCPRALLPVLLLAGCSALPLEYHPGNEIPHGPGMLTGEDGAIVLRLGLRRGDLAEPVRKRTSGASEAP